MDTPLHRACIDNNLEQVVRLLETNPEDVCKTNDLGDTPLHIACKRQNIDIITAILNKNNQCIDIKNSTEDTPLMIACMMRNDEMVELLLSNGANPSVIRSDGETAVSIAIELEERGIADKIKSMEIELSPPETLTRSLSTSHSYQGSDPTCIYHTVAKLYGQNIFKIHTKTWDPSICDKYLNTTKPPNFNIVPPCDKNKIIMFYYIYFLLKKKYRLNALPIEDIPDLIDRVNQKEIPDELIEYQPLIHSFLDKPTHVIYKSFVFNKKGNNTILYRYLYHCLKNLNCYVGMSIIHSNLFKGYSGHSITVVDINDKELVIKNSWANTFFILNMSNLHDTNIWIEHGFFRNSIIRFYFILDVMSVPGNPKNQEEFERLFIHRNTEIHFGGKTKRKRKCKTKKYK